MSAVQDDEPRGLRARNKQAVREALSEAALRLAVEQGPGGLSLVRVADIASAAGVAPRTYNNYFTSREEAICSFQADQAGRLGKALRARPATESLSEAVIAAAVEVFTDPEPDRAGLSMIMSTPQLRGEALKAFAMAEEPLAEALAERLPSTLAGQVLAASVAAAVRVAGRHWLSTKRPPSSATVPREALTYALEAPDSLGGPPPHRQ